MRNTKGQFQLGHSGGRPKGARNKLAAQVFEDILRHWCEPAAPGSKLCKGAEALETALQRKARRISPPYRQRATARIHFRERHLGPGRRTDRRASPGAASAYDRGAYDTG